MQIKKGIINNRKIIENFSYLTIFQVFTLLSPILTYPYLIRIVGLEMYGVVVFAQTIVTYFSLLINFGFNISGPKDVALCKDDQHRLSEYVSSIYIIKVIIWVICFIIYVIAIYTFPFFRHHILLYILTYFITISDVFFPIWFFQGIEKMKYITYINLFVKSLFIIAIFIFIKHGSDYIYIPLLNSIGALITAVIAIYIVFGKEGVAFIRVAKQILTARLKEGFSLFISAISVQLYLNVNKIIVGTMLGMKEVAIYDLGDKITNLLKIPIGMISQAVFPKISREKSIAFINKIMFLVVAIVSVVYLALFFTSDWIVFFFTKTKIPMAINIVRILGLSLIFVSLNVFLSSNRLIPFGFNRKFMFVAVANSLVYFLVIGILFLVHFINIYSITITYVFVEIFCFVLLLFINKRLNLLWHR